MSRWRGEHLPGREIAQLEKHDRIAIVIIAIIIIIIIIIIIVIIVIIISIISTQQQWALSTRTSRRHGGG